jgi:hypothetical protein
MNPNPQTLTNQYDVNCNRVDCQALYIDGVLVDPVYMDEGPTVTCGTTLTAPEGYPAAVSNSGTSHDMVLNFSIPIGQPGIPGDSASCSVGTTNTLVAGSNATCTNSGDATNCILNFGTWVLAVNTIVTNVDCQ